MPVRREGQLEKYLDDATRKHDFQALEQFLETDFSDGICHKCSKQFLNKFDRLICQGLEREEVENVTTLLNILQKHGKNINILGEVGFPAMIEYGLVQKKVKEILKYKVNEKNDSFTTFFENFFDVLMIIHDTSSEGKIQILENFVLRTCALTAEKRINVYIQQEAVRKLNVMLDSMPRDTRKKIISTKEMLAIMNDMGKRILDAGDYDLQVAITEALCRMTSEKQRGELASQWFSMEFVTDAFKGIKDFEFETDCRKFLNKVNGMLGDKRRVFTYPCLSANLDEHELQIPADENLEEFWIDFNIGSKSVSFYIAADDEGQQWETVCIPEKDVKTYIIEEQDKRKLLIIHLNNPTSVGIQEGEKIILHFDSALEIADIAKKVYGAVKCQGFTKKKTMSVAKTTVHVIFDETGSQVLVPESQITQLEENNCKLLKENGSHSLQNLYPQTQKNMNGKANTIDIQTVQSKITPAKRKMSEASMVVPSAGRLSMQSLLPFMNTSTPQKGRIKVPLKMQSPVEKVNNTLHNEENLNTNNKQKLDEVIDIVPESQLVEKSDKPLLPGLLENSLAEIKTQRRQTCWVPETIIMHCNRQSISSLGNTFPEAINLSDGAAKQRAFSSIFEKTSSELRNKHHCNGDIVELQHNENKTPAKNHNINSADSWNTFKHMDKEISKSSRRKNISSKSEISLNAMKMNDTSLENSRHLKLAIETNENASFDVSSSGKKTANKKTDQKRNSKEKDAAAELISKISNRYKERTSLNQSSFSVSQKKNKNRSFKNLKTTTLLNITTEQLVDDVYNFSLNGFDEPTIKLGFQEVHLSKMQATTELPKKMNHENEVTYTVQKKQDKKKRTNKSKKYLFSDTDTEYRGDDTRTDISWLKESNRKPKPQLVDYSRNKKQKISTTLAANKSAVSPSRKKTFQEKKNINNKTPVSRNQHDHGAEKKAQSTRSKQPRRAALAKKCYRELSTSETESEEEYSEHLIKKSTLKEHAKQKKNKNKVANQLNVQQCIVSSKTTKGKWINQQTKSTKSKDMVQKTQINSSPLPSSESSASFDIIRGCEKHTEDESVEEHASFRRSSLSCDLQELTSEKEESLGIIENIPALVTKNTESVLLNQLSEKDRKLMFENEDLSPVLSPLSLPNLSPFAARKNITSDHDVEVAKFPAKIYDADEAPSIKKCLLNRSSDVELKDFSESLMEKGKETSVSPSPLFKPSGSRGELCEEETLTNIHESGPTVHTNFKRLYQKDIESDSDEEEIRREERKTKLLPRKLFKADDSTYKAPESISTLSINETPAFDGKGWDADSSSIGMICQKLHKEFARKIQTRSKKTDGFTKQTLKTAYQYMNTMSNELHKHRTKQLENLHSSLIKEIESFEKDSEALRSMEKDLSNFSKKHSETFSTYHKNEQRRLQNLKTSFEKNIYHNSACEKDICTSEMNQMKEDMKEHQNRFLKEMHEEELLNVRKGLQSLFMAENGRL